MPKLIRGTADLWARPYHPPHIAGNPMRLAADAKRAVIFIGHADENGDNFSPAGTAFFLAYNGCRYLVTARHVAEQLEDDPFHFRINATDGGSGTLHYDPYLDGENHPWQYPLDDTVDLAVMELNLDFRAEGYDALMLDQRFLLTKEEYESGEIGPGDVCYAVGLFKLMAGKGRNLPIVHTGNLAMMPSEELVPCKDWKNHSKLQYVEGALVQMTNLEGLSGSPVFIRPIAFEFDPEELVEGPKHKTAVSLHRANIQLFGVWMASWDGVASASTQQSGQRTPLGVGIVVPSYKLIDLLESKSVSEARNKVLARMEAKRAAILDSSSEK